MEYDITIQHVQSEIKDLPDDQTITTWIEMVLQNQRIDNVEVCIRLVDDKEIAALNEEYRQQAKPTNVLSFPIEADDNLELPLQPLGDIVICPAIVNEEAITEEKSHDAHWAHIIIHGILHLLGYDHIEDEGAETMENIEIKLLQQLGYPNPYQEETTHE